MVPLDRAKRNRRVLLAFVTMRFFDLTEWAQSLRLASDSQLAEFGAEVLDLIDADELARRYSEILESLEKATSHKLEPKDPDETPWRWGEYVEALVSEKEQRREKLRERALRINAAEIPPLLEYDL